MESRAVGWLNLTLVSILFSYYTAWVVLLPFVDEAYLPLAKKAFPLGPEYALGIPCALAAAVCLPLLLRAYQLVRQDREADAAK